MARWRDRAVLSTHGSPDLHRARRGRWVWLGLSLAIASLIVRAMSVGRVRLSATHLEIRTVLGTRRFRRSDVRGFAVQRTRTGAVGITRDALAVETSAGVTVISDVNVASGSGLLDRICETVNERIRPMG